MPSTPSDATTGGASAGAGAAEGSNASPSLFHRSAAKLQQGPLSSQPSLSSDVSEASSSPRKPLAGIPQSRLADNGGVASSAVSVTAPTPKNSNRSTTPSMAQLRARKIMSEAKKARDRTKVACPISPTSIGGDESIDGAASIVDLDTVAHVGNFIHSMHHAEGRGNRPTLKVETNARYQSSLDNARNAILASPIAAKTPRMQETESSRDGAGAPTADKPSQDGAGEEAGLAAVKPRLKVETNARYQSSLDHARNAMLASPLAARTPRTKSKEGTGETKPGMDAAVESAGDVSGDNAKKDAHYHAILSQIQQAVQENNAGSLGSILADARKRGLPMATATKMYQEERRRAAAGQQRNVAMADEGKKAEAEAKGTDAEGEKSGGKEARPTVSAISPRSPAIQKYRKAATPKTNEKSSSKATGTPQDEEIVDSAVQGAPTGAGVEKAGDEGHGKASKELKAAKTLEETCPDVPNAGNDTEGAVAAPATETTQNTPAAISAISPRSPAIQKYRKAASTPKTNEESSSNATGTPQDEEIVSSAVQGALAGAGVEKAGDEGHGKASEEPKVAETLEETCPNIPNAGNDVEGAAATPATETTQNTAAAISAISPRSPAIQKYRKAASTPKNPPPTNKESSSKATGMLQEEEGADSAVEGVPAGAAKVAARDGRVKVDKEPGAAETVMEETCPDAAYAGNDVEGAEAKRAGSRTTVEEGQEEESEVEPGVLNESQLYQLQNLALKAEELREANLALEVCIEGAIQQSLGHAGSGEAMTLEQDEGVQEIDAFFAKFAIHNGGEQAIEISPSNGEGECVEVAQSTKSSSDQTDNFKEEDGADSLGHGREATCEDGDSETAKPDDVYDPMDEERVSGAERKQKSKDAPVGDENRNVNLPNHLGQWKSPWHNSDGALKKRHCLSVDKRLGSFTGYSNIDFYSLYEATVVKAEDEDIDKAPWEYRDVGQRFLHEKSLESRNWFGSFALERGNDRVPNPVCRPKALEIGVTRIAEPGEWSEEWYTTWKSRRDNPNNLLAYAQDETGNVKESLPRIASTSSPTVKKVVEIGSLCPVRVKSGERVSRVHPDFTSSLRQSRWRKKYLKGMFRAD